MGGNAGPGENANSTAKGNRIRANTRMARLGRVGPGHYSKILQPAGRKPVRRGGFRPESAVRVGVFHAAKQPAGVPFVVAMRVSISELMRSHESPRPFPPRLFDVVGRSRDVVPLRACGR